MSFSPQIGFLGHPIIIIIIPVGPAVLCVETGMSPEGTPVSLSMAALFWGGFCAVVGCGAWGFHAVERGKQRGIGTGYFNGIETIQSSLSAQFSRTPCPGSWEGCGDSGWNLFLQYSQILGTVSKQL